MLNIENNPNKKDLDVKSRFLSGKKPLLMLMLASMLAFTARGQVLQNSLWRAYVIAPVPELYWHFGQDTMSYSTDNVSFTDASVFTTVANLFTIVDIGVTNCSISDSGTYNFLINGDTLRFTIIADPCSNRSSYFAPHYFLRFTTGIENINSISPATISPNPSADGIFNLSFTGNNNLPKRIYVMAADGRKIMDVGAENFLPLHTGTTINHTINLQSCASGIYFLVMENDLGRKVFKLVK